MAFTLGDVKTAIQARGFSTDTTAAQTTAVQGVLRRLYGMRRWHFLETTNTSLVTVIGTATVSTATVTDLQKIDALRLTLGTSVYDLEYRQPQELRTWDAADSRNDVPMRWTQRDALIQLWPRPNAVYTLQLDYIKRPTVPAADATAITWPDEFQDVLVEGAIAEVMASRERNWAMRDRAVVDFKDRLGEMMRADGLVQRQTAGRVQRWDGWNQVER